jgi:hypothetical protein
MRNPTSGSGSEDEAQKEDPVIRPGPYVENFGVGSDAKALSRQVESRQRSSLLLEHDLFGKPVPTFPDHALDRVLGQS